MSFWYQAKLMIEHASGISMDALHVVVGVLLQLLFAGLFRASLNSWWPWLSLFVLLLLNEAGDLWVERWPELGMQIGEGLKDVTLTMFLPTVLMLGARLRPAMFGGGNPVNGEPK